MGHLVLVLPLLGLIVFWFLPLEVALPVYLIILALSAALYRSILKAMHRPVSVGIETMIGQEGEVVEVSPRGARVALGGELWKAVSDTPLMKGERVEILQVRGLSLRVKRSEGKRHNQESMPGSPHQPGA
jgi:membrane-bound serine protease (ClpP class)